MPDTRSVHVGIVGGGPAGLMAAEVLSAVGIRVTILEGMPTVGRKFLMAGKSGLNLTHAEPHEVFKSRFGMASKKLEPALDAFTGDDVRKWASALGVETFAGSSGRVFPTAMKGSPLLRAWLKRLEEQGVTLLTRHRWAGFVDDALLVETVDGLQTFRFDAVVLALGGASWPRLGSDAGWVPWLEGRGVKVNAFKPANCGFDVAWSEILSERFAGQPVKAVVATSAAGATQGEFVITAGGVEGSLIYTHSAALRDVDKSVLMLDLAPARDVERLERDLKRQSSKASFSNRLRKGAGLDAVKVALVRELTSEAQRGDSAALARAIKALPLPLLRPRPIAEAISSAGGVGWDAVGEHYMLNTLPGVFVAGEMLDWEAPTGGYLLTGCLATGRAAARGVLAYLKR